MKRCFSVLLVIALVASVVIPTFAEASNYNDYLGIDESEYDMDAYYAALWDNYSLNMHGLLWEAICDDQYYVYAQTANEVGSDGWIKFASNVTGQSLTKERYIEILVNLMAMMDYNMSELVNNQVEADTLKTFKDYALDVGGILVQSFSLDAAFGSNVTETMKKIANTMDLTWDSVEYIESIEEYQYFSWTLKKYECYDLFLTAIVQNSKDALLKEAAKELLGTVDKAFFVRMNAATEWAEEFAGYLGKDVFFDTIVLEYMLDSPDVLDISESGFAIITTLKTAYDFLGTLSLATDLAVFAADMLVGISDIMNRYNEMCALTNIRYALIEQLSTWRNAANSAKDIETIGKMCALMKNLVYVNYRGEYCAHEMLTQDAQAYSLVIRINGQIETIARVFEQAKENTAIYVQTLEFFIFPNLEDYRREVLEPDTNLSFLTEGYWVNSIQCHMIYKFHDDGTYYAYYYDPTQEIAEENFQLAYSATYIFDGNALRLIFDSGSEISLELVTTDSPIDWDGGLSNQINAIPDGVPFFYETGWVSSGYISENAMYLTRIEAPNGEQVSASILTFNGHGYQVFDSVCDSWEEAKEYCENLGGYLATITSQEENDAIFSWINSLGYPDVYFGLSDSESEGVWQWASGESVTYTNWHSGEPNGESSNENYAMFYHKFKDGTWNDGSFGGDFASEQKVFICEWDSISDNSSVISLDELTIIAESHYTGNMGDSRIFNLNGNGLIGNDNIGYRNGNESLGGSLLENGFEVWIARWNFGDNISWASATFDLKNQYVKLTGKTDIIKSYNTTSYDATIYFYDGDILLASYRITPDHYQMTIDVDVSNVKELTILVKDNIEAAGGTSFALYDMFLD